MSVEESSGSRFLHFLQSGESFTVGMLKRLKVCSFCCFGKAIIFVFVITFCHLKKKPEIGHEVNLCFFVLLRKCFNSVCTGKFLEESLQLPNTSFIYLNQQLITAYHLIVD